MSSANVGVNVQFKHRDCREIDVMIGCLVRGALRTKVPLLPDDVLERLSVIRRPPQNILLGTFSVGLFKMHPNPSQGLWMVEEKTDRLFSGPCSPPPRSSIGQQGMLNGMRGIL